MVFKVDSSSITHRTERVFWVTLWSLLCCSLSLLALSPTTEELVGGGLGQRRSNKHKVETLPSERRLLEPLCSLLPLFAPMRGPYAFPNTPQAWMLEIILLFFGVKAELPPLSSLGTEDPACFSEVEHM